MWIVALESKCKYTHNISLRPIFYLNLNIQNGMSHEVLQPRFFMHLLFVFFLFPLSNYIFGPSVFMIYWFCDFIIYEIEFFLFGAQICQRMIVILVGFEGLIEVSMKMAVCWVLAQCSLVEVYHSFRGTCYFHHQGFEWSWWWRQQVSLKHW